MVGYSGFNGVGLFSYPFNPQPFLSLIIRPDSRTAWPVATMIKLNLFGRGLKLQIAIMVGCQMAFIL